MAKRMFERGTRLSDRIGCNEKTRITVRLVRPTETAALSSKRKGSAASKKADATAATAIAATTNTTDSDTGAGAVPLEVGAAAAVMDSKMLQKYVHEQFGTSQAAKRQRTTTQSGPDPDDEVHVSVSHDCAVVWQVHLTIGASHVGRRTVD